MPPLLMAVIMIVELVIFAVIVERLARNYRGRAWLGPVCFLLAKAISLVILLLLPGILTGTPSLERFVMSIVNAWPGLVILALLSYYIPKRFPLGGAPA